MTVRNWIHLPFLCLLAVGCEELFGDDVGDGTGTGGGGTSTDTGTGTGEPIPGAFQRRAFLSASLEFDGKINQGEIPGFPEDCKSNDMPDDVSRLAERMDQVEDWEVRYARDAHLNPSNNLVAELPQISEQYRHEVFPEWGMDESNADGYDLLYWSGHGFPGQLYYNTSGPQGCSIAFQESIRLGTFCGQQNKVAAFSASCVLAIDQTMCALTEDLNEDGIGDTPLPDACWNPVTCMFALGSASNTILTFADSPIVTSDDSLRWYGASISGQPAAQSWHGLANSAYMPGVTKNQPITLSSDSTFDGAIERWRFGTLASGDFLEQLDPDTPSYFTVMAYVNWKGETVFDDAEGNPINAWDMPDVPDADCLLDHSEVCTPDINPPEAALSECM